MSRRQSYIATKSDLVPGLKAFEARLAVKYMSSHWQRTPDYTIYPSALDLPDFGIAASDTSGRNPEYLVMEAQDMFNIREIIQYDGEIYYEPTKAKDGPYLLYEPGGLFQENCLIAGNIWVPMTTPEAQSLYRRFVRAITKNFVSVQGMDRKYLVGPEAIKLAQSGVRLITSFTGEPEEYDLNEQILSLTASI